MTKRAAFTIWKSLANKLKLFHNLNVFSLAQILDCSLGCLKQYRYLKEGDKSYGYNRAIVRTSATGAWHPSLFVAWVPRVPDFNSFSSFSLSNLLFEDKCVRVLNKLRIHVLIALHMSIFGKYPGRVLN